MALVANTWYLVNFTTPSVANTPPWDNTIATTIPGEITLSMLLGTQMYVFCVAAGVPQDVIAILGNNFVSMIDAVMTVVSTPAMNLSTGPNGATWYSIRVGNEWYWYDSITGVVSYVADGTVLGGFIA